MMYVKYMRSGKIYVVLHFVNIFDGVCVKRIRLYPTMKTAGKILGACCLGLFILLTFDAGLPGSVYSNNMYTVLGPPRIPINAQQLPKGNRTLPSAIIFGIRKCGTRALLDFLNGHPDIRAAEYEVHYFDRNYDKGIDWYRSQMPYVVNSSRQLAVEKTPAYFITPEAASRIHAMDKNIKLILIVRDPVTRAISDYTQILHNREGRNESIAPFEALVLDETNSVNLDFKPLWVSIYHHHFTPWLKYFPLSQIHVVDGDQLVKDPSSELTKLETFLHLEPYLTPDKFYFNQTKGFYCMYLRSGDSKCLGDSKGRSHQEINPKVLHKLKQFYKIHNKLFFHMIKRTFDAW